MQRIEDWLNGLGLSEYAPRFVENDIDWTILGDLTDQDLEKIGVKSLGHRRKLLRAIAEVSKTPEQLPVEPPVASAPVDAKVLRPLPATATAGERRFLTVMFCDLVGSTSIAAGLDAEEWRNVVGAYLDAASAAVTEMGGYVAKKLGDGLMSLFGYPVAQENDAERAARAALAIQTALAKLERMDAGTGKPRLTARIGLEAGPVVVDAAGEIFGDAPNIAARVQALAEPGTVLVTARVLRQIAGLFVAEERGNHALRGLPEPVTLFRLVRASGGGRRSGQRNLTPLVGRDEEIAMLLRRWERVRQGDGQLVMIVGEPGLGKSRLVEELHARLRETPHTWVEWSCSQLSQNTPLHPIGEWGRQRFGGSDVPAERRLADLESSLSQVKLDPAENVPLLAPLLDIPLPKERASSLTPEELRRRQLAALTAWVMAGARTQPVVLALEDLHWADPTTLDVLRGIAERGALAPLFLLVTGRPESPPPWGTRSHHSTISLVPLDRQQVRHMVVGLAAQHALSKEMIDSVTERTGGVPLFVEEVTRLLLEGGPPDSTQAIPPTLQQSLAARLDRLGSAREVAQIASVIGRDFSYRLLRVVAGTEERQLQVALERLAEADVLLVQGLPPESDYRFKHALIQDAAYENLLKSWRTVLHRRVAEALRDKFPVIAAAEPEVVAHHFTEAALVEPAVDHWLLAGKRAAALSADFEAVAHLNKGLSLLANAPTCDDRTRLELELRLAIGSPLIATRGWAALETMTSYQRAQELCQELNDRERLLPALYGEWAGYFARCDVVGMRTLARRFSDLTRLTGTPGIELIGLRMVALDDLYGGNLEDARDGLNTSVERYDAKRDEHIAIQYGTDNRAVSLSYLAWAVWLLGFPDRAAAAGQDAVALARELTHANSKCVAQFVGDAMLNLFLRHPERTEKTARDLIKFSDDAKIPTWKAFGQVSLGAALSEQGNPKEGLQEIATGLSSLKGTGTRRLLPLFLCWKTVAEMRTGKPESAVDTIEAAFSNLSETGETIWMAEVLRTRALLGSRVKSNMPFDPEADLLNALEHSRAHQARSFELRSACDLARVWRNQGKRRESYNLLSSVFEWFTEGLASPDLIDAKVLLRELS